MYLYVNYKSKFRLDTISEVSLWILFLFGFRVIIKTSTKHKHLTREDRIIIEESLNKNAKLKEISEHIGKDPTTISKEIKRNRIELLPSRFNQSKGVS